MNDDEELFIERAAIAEYDGGNQRAIAEKMAAAYVERYRHECEVRWCCGNPSKVRAYIADVRAKRGDEAADRLYADAQDQ